MNVLKVETYNEKLMEMADKEFDVVIHFPEDCSNDDFSGEFLIYDTLSEMEIKDKVTDMHETLKKKKV